MNESGPPAQAVATFYKVPPHRILVVVDDLDLPFGRLRLRREGSSGGHNGLKSLIEAFGPGFPRLRAGIGRDRENAAIRRVLGTFSAEEETALPELIDRCIAGIETWLENGIDAAMNRVNVMPIERRPPGNAPEVGNTDE